MSIPYRFYLLDRSSRVLGSLHGDFTTDHAALACASYMLKGASGIEVWQDERLVGRLTPEHETVDEVIADTEYSSDVAESEESRPNP